MESLISLLGIAPGDCVALVGCGGKTSLLWALADRFRARPVLVCSSTRMLRPDARCCDRFLPPGALAGQKPLPGVTLSGEEDEAGKLHMPDRALPGLAALGYDFVFIEADGSKGRPLKGWAAHEPVVPACATRTVGIQPLWPVGLPLDEQLVHRPAIFCEDTGARMGQPVTLAHIAAAVAGPRGLFAKARGQRVLLLNQVEDARGRALARELVSLLPGAFKQQLDGIVAGSVCRDEGEMLWGR